MKRILLSILAMLTAGCEILEYDLSARRVEVIAPARGAIAPPGPVAFRWQATPHATGYALTVVSPSFAAARRIAADTLVRADTLGVHAGCTVMLGEGRYEWCVKAFNNGSATPAQVRALTVHDQSRTAK